MQYVVTPPTLRAETYARAVADPDVVDLNMLAEDGPLSIRQLLAPPYSLLKLDFGAIHRGIANTGKNERVMFWLSVKRPGSLLPIEPLLQDFPK